MPSESTASATAHEVRFTIARSSLGWVLVAATDQVIRCIDLGTTPWILIDRLRARSPMARLLDDDPACAARAAQISVFIEAPRRDLDLPLDIRGTAFQQRVWRALRGIPPGATASYGDIAKRVGEPATAQGVAQARAANPFCACHPVPSRRAKRRRSGRLPLGRWAQA